MMGNETAARQTEQDAERQRMAVLNRLLKENLEQLDAYRLQWGEDGLMYVSALGTIADIYYTQGQTDKALPIWNLSSPAKQPRCVIFSVSRKPRTPGILEGYPFLTGQYSPSCSQYRRNRYT